MYACIYVCMYICMHACVYVCMHVCMYAFMYVCLHVCMHVCMYVCMYVCICIITKISLNEIPTIDEMARAIAGLKDGKAPGGDGIPAEVWKDGGDNLFNKLHQLITNAWDVDSVPQARKDANIVTIYKKSDRTDMYLSTSVRRSIQLGGPYYGSY